MNDVMNLLKTKKACLTYLASKLPENNFELLKDHFLHNDRDKTGTLSGNDFKRCLSAAHMKATDPEVDTLVKELDHLSKDEISY